MLRRCDGSIERLRWPLGCPLIRYARAYTDKVSPHRLRGSHMKCVRGQWTRRGVVMRMRRAGVRIGTAWRTWR